MSCKIGGSRHSSYFDYRNVMRIIIKGLPRELYWYVNYEKLQLEAEKSGIPMERSEESYGKAVLKCMKEICSIIPKDKFSSLKFLFDPQKNTWDAYPADVKFDPTAECLVDSLYGFTFYDKSMKRDEATYGNLILDALKKIYRNIPEDRIDIAEDMYSLYFDLDFLYN